MALDSMLYQWAKLADCCRLPKTDLEASNSALTLLTAPLLSTGNE